VKPNSLMRRIDTWWTARPDEGLTLSDACAKFNCTPEQFARAVEKANRILGLGASQEPFYRLGPRVSARPTKKRGNKAPIRQNHDLASIFSGQALRLRLNGGSAGPRVIERAGDSVRVTAITPQETEEWRAAEAARRARQRVPKPAGNARRRSKKLLELIGDDIRDD
jgi:hypothetical protein